MMRQLTHLSLFSGIGGLDIAAERAGFRSVGQCEWADYPTKVLEKHWPDVPRWRDIRTLTGDDFYARTGLRTVDVISGGFPCQPFSVAGKQRGKEDDRYLWPEMCRVISEIRPTWVIGENVPGIVNLALDEVLSDLESQGYTCQTFIIPVAGVDAPHRRDRICIVARNHDSQSNGGESCDSHTGAQERENAYSGGDCFLSNPDGDGCAGQSGEPFESRCDADQVNSAIAANCDVPHADRDGRDTWRPESAGQQRQTGVADGSNDVPDTHTIRCDMRGSGRERVRRPEPPCHEIDSGCENVADSMCIGSAAGAANPPPGEKGKSAKPFNGGTPAANAESPKRQRKWREARGRRPEFGCGGWWPAEPNVGRVANGVPARVDRLKCLGNAVVPSQFYPFFKYIAEIERGGANE